MSGSRSSGVKTPSLHSKKPNKFKHTCPKCKKVTAKSDYMIDRKFGFRVTKDGEGLEPQSYCRKCRK